MARRSHLDQELADDFGRYLYLPRLRNSSVLTTAIQSGLSLLSSTQESFAYVDNYDEGNKRYRGLRCAKEWRCPLRALTRVTSHAHYQDAVNAASRKKLPDLGILVCSRRRNDDVPIFNDGAARLAGQRATRAGGATTAMCSTGRAGRSRSA